MYEHTQPEIAKTKGGKMKLDIMLAGVGGQGILSIATVIGVAAVEAGICLKQAEAHGMSQRGGDVQSHLRLATGPIHSDLIEKGKADMIMALEPMEALRYVQYLSADGMIVTSSAPFVNIPDYPDSGKLERELSSFPNVVKADVVAASAQAGVPRSSNIMLLGMAAPFMKILSPEALRRAVATFFVPKGETVVEANLKAFDMGLEMAGK